MKFATTLLKDTIKQVRVELLVISVSLTVALVSHCVSCTNIASTHTGIIDILLTQVSDSLIALYDGKILVQALVLEWKYP